MLLREWNISNCVLLASQSRKDQSNSLDMERGAPGLGQASDSQKLEG